jgi:hypothetical protein
MGKWEIATLFREQILPQRRTGEAKKTLIVQFSLVFARGLLFGAGPGFQQTKRPRRLSPPHKVVGATENLAPNPSLLQGGGQDGGAGLPYYLSGDGCGGLGKASSFQTDCPCLRGL